MNNPYQQPQARNPYLDPTAPTNTPSVGAVPPDGAPPEPSEEAVETAQITWQANGDGFPIKNSVLRLMLADAYAVDFGGQPPGSRFNPDHVERCNYCRQPLRGRPSEPGTTAP
jgi:hypothetical protein